MTKLNLFYLCFISLAIASNAIAEEDSWSNVFKFQKKMAAMGNVKAQYILGEMYEEGRGVKEDQDKAISWYTKAQKNGHKKAASSIERIKDKIRQAKLEAKKVIKKIVKKNKPKKLKKSKPIKSVIKENKKTQATNVTTKTEKISKQAKKTSLKKQPKKSFSPEDFNRAKGTHMDNFEDPFD